jgi:hypothetical protein
MTAPRHGSEWPTMHQRTHGKQDWRGRQLLCRAHAGARLQHLPLDPNAGKEKFVDCP